MDYSSIIVLLEGMMFNNVDISRKPCRTLTRAPITPRDVRRRYSKGRVLEVVLRNGYKKSGMCAIKETA